MTASARTALVVTTMTALLACSGTATTTGPATTATVNPTTDGPRPSSAPPTATDASTAPVVAPDLPGANAAAGSATSGTTCPDESDGIIWGSDEALRVLVMGAGNDHLEEVTDAVTAWGDDAGVDVTTANLSLYSAPVLGREIAGRLAGDPPPDAAEGIVGGVLAACAAQGRLLDLTATWDRAGLHAVVPTAVADLATVDGRRWFVPTTVQWNALWYRPDVFDDLDLDPPGTWDELLAACDTLEAADLTPFSLGVATWRPPVARWFSHLDLALNGPDFHQRLLAGLESWDDPRVTAVFDRWRELLDRGCFGTDVRSTTYQEAIDAVVDGDAGLLDLGSWIHESIPPEDSEVLAVAPFPVLDETVERAEIATVQGALVPAGTRMPDRARDLVATLGGPERLEASQPRLRRTVVRTDVPAGDWPWADAERRAVVDAERIVQLLEFTAEDRYATVILGGLVEFVGDPASRPDVVARIEASRTAVFG